MSSAEIYQEILRLQECGESAALATIISTIGSTPAKLNSKMLIKPNGEILGTVGGGCLEAEVYQESLEVIQKETPKILEYSLTEKDVADYGLVCGGRVILYVEPLVTPTVFLFGAGHIARSVGTLLKMVGLRMIVVDDRERYANKTRFPDAAAVHVGDWDSVLPSLSVNENAYLVILTRGHQYDEIVLGWALKTPARYIGMIGSKVKIKKIYQNLADKGIDRPLFDRVHAPIGLPIHSVTHEEIAVSIVAEIISIRRQHWKSGESSCQIHGQYRSTKSSKIPNEKNEKLEKISTSIDVK
ncbi:MAG: XdhC/CoxI family protein [Planctomycetota bacterium]